MIKGFVSACQIYHVDKQFIPKAVDDLIHVHQTSEGAVEVERLVEKVGKGFLPDWVGMITVELPAALIGKRVRCIIEVIKGEDK